MRLRPLLFFLSVTCAAGVLPDPVLAVPTGVGAMPALAPGLLFKADTFPNCQEVRRCGPDRRGRYRCRPVVRCQECRYVKRCGGSLGCRWEEVCRWGPYKPPLKTN